MTWGKRWYVTDADGVQLTKMLGGGDIIASLPIKLPAWWSPEQREAYRIIAVGGVLRPERYTSRDEAFAARGFSERVQRITADLETGAEVPV